MDLDYNEGLSNKGASYSYMENIDDEEGRNKLLKYNVPLKNQEVIAIALPTEFQNRKGFRTTTNKENKRTILSVALGKYTCIDEFFGSIRIPKK